MVKLLLGEGACLAQSRSNFGDALTAAAAEGHISTVQFLLDAGAEINSSSRKYGSALHAAANKGKLEVVKLLLARGADVNQTGGMWYTALQATLLSFYSAEEKTIAFEIFHTLVEHGAEIDTVGGKYGSALHSASFKGFDEVVQLLIDKGVNANLFGGIFAYPLQAAASMEHWGIHIKTYPYFVHDFVNHSTVEKLLNAGADVNALGGRNGTALQAAAQVGNEYMVKLLLDRGADVNMEFKQRGTALAAAASLGPPDGAGLEGLRREDRPRSWFRNIVRTLLDSGAVVDGRVMKIATATGDEQIISMLEEKFDESAIEDDHEDESLLGNLFD